MAASTLAPTNYTGAVVTSMVTTVPGSKTNSRIYAKATGAKVSTSSPASAVPRRPISRPELSNTIVKSGKYNYANSAAITVRSCGAMCKKYFAKYPHGAASVTTVPAIVQQSRHSAISARNLSAENARATAGSSARCTT